MMEGLHPTGQEPLIHEETEPHYPYDAIILLCGGVHRDRAKKDSRGIKLNFGRYNSPIRIRKTIGGQRTGDWTGNFETELKVAAAAQAYEEELAPIIISSGGPMWAPIPLGQIMADELTKEYNIPSENVIKENEATDTGIQMKNILDIVREHGFQKVAVIADSVHLPVAEQLLKNWAKHEGIPLEVNGLKMEDLLVQINPRYKMVIGRMYRSLYWKWWTRKYRTLARDLETDPLLTSRKNRTMATIIKVMRTKSPFYNFRLPGTT